MKYLLHIASEFQIISNQGVDISEDHRNSIKSQGDPIQDRFKGFYDAAYGSWTYPDPYTEQIIMDAPNKLFALDHEE